LWIWILAILIFFCVWLQYLIFIFVIIILLLARQSAAVVLALWIESVDDNLLGAFNLSATERTTLERTKRI
jgi:hypothetical protein